MSTTAPIIGSGPHTYRVIDAWPKLPDHVRFGNTHAVCETADGTILVHSPSPTGDCVIEFDPDGRFIRSWGREFFPGAHGMQLRREGGQEFLYFATSTQHTVVKTDLRGERVFELSYPADAIDPRTSRPCYASAEKYLPTNVAFAPGEDGGDFYVADGYGAGYVHQYDARGRYVRSWGGEGTADGEMRCPHGIHCDTRDPANPRIVVADRTNVRLQWFTLDGKHVKTVGHDLRAPCHFDQRGDDLLIPDLLGRVTIFGQDDRAVVHLGDNPNESQRANNGVPREQLVPGVFCTPHGACWDRAGNIYAAEWLPYGRVTKLQRV